MFLSPHITAADATATPVLALANYSAGIFGRDAMRTIVDGVDLTLRAGEIVALVGESGSGKSFLCRSLFGLDGGWRSGGGQLAGTKLVRARVRNYEVIGGRQAAMIFQNPNANLDPLMSVGRHLVATLRGLHRLPRREAVDRAEALLAQVGLRPDDVMRALPHELSGGMNQRVMIALALCGEPQLLIADEPTMALDVTIQRQVMELLVGLAKARRMAVLLVTHNLGLARQYADRVAVMYAGRVVEAGPAEALVTQPRHPYAQALLACSPRLDGPKALQKIPGQMPSLRERGPGCAFANRCGHTTARCGREAPPATALPDRTYRCWHPVAEPAVAASAVPDAAVVRLGAVDPVLQVRDLVVAFPGRSRFGPFGRRQPVKALDGISLTLNRGEVLGIIGESGSGKSTLARAVLGLVRPTSGTLELAADAVGRRQVQMIFQDAFGSLNPRFSALEAVADCLELCGLSDAAARRQRAAQLLAAVELPADRFGARREQLSGGQAQRVAIARALAAEPQILICDEPTSALDVSVQAQIVALLQEVRLRTGLSMLFISHDLAVVRSIADRIVVMRQGRIVETGSTDQVLAAPQHDYTKALLAAVPGNARQVA